MRVVLLQELRDVLLGLEFRSSDVFDSLMGAELEEVGLRRSLQTAKSERNNRCRLEKAPPRKAGSRILPHVHAHLNRSTLTNS
jgi:hypothetical protein